jgi:8-oxo-dGTP diphosphatase
MNNFPFAVCILGFRQDNVLVVSRRNDPTKWGLVGGKVDNGETPIEAIIREVFEETGLRMNSQSLVELYTGVCPGAVTYNVITYLYTHEFPDAKHLVAENGLTLTYAPFVKLLDSNVSPFAEYNKGVLEAYKAL